MRIPSELTRGLDEVDKSAIQEVIKGNHVIVRKLRGVCEKKLNDAIKNLENIDNYDSPEFKGLVADNCGYRRAIREILRLLPKGEQ